MKGNSIIQRNCMQSYDKFIFTYFEAFNLEMLPKHRSILDAK